MLRLAAFILLIDQQKKDFEFRKEFIDSQSYIVAHLLFKHFIDC